MFEFKECDVNIHCFFIPNAVLETGDLSEYVNSVNSEFTGSLYESNKKVEDDDE